MQIEELKEQPAPSKDIKLEDFVVQRITSLCEERNMSMYKLSQLTGIAQSSLSTMMHGKTLPSIVTLAKLCEGLEISIFDFFDQTEASTVITNQEKIILRYWNHLNEHQKEVALAFIKGLLAESELK